VPLKEQVKKMVVAFDGIGVKVEHLEKRLGHDMNATIATEIVTLRKIYESINTGMASREEFFDFGKKQTSSELEKDLVNELSQDKKKGE
jgi:hypothetical protein